MQNFLVGSRALQQCLVACGATLGLAFGPSAVAQTPGPSLSAVMYFYGTAPQGGLVRGSDGALYGTGSESNLVSTSYGLHYRLSPDASGVQTIYEYGRLGVFTGGAPRTGLLLGSDGYFYGTNTINSVDLLRGPQSGTGGVFRMAQDGSGHVRLADFDPIRMDYTRNSIGYAINDCGFQPQAALIEGLENGVRYLYGTTRQGGKNGTGVVFKVRADGTRLPSAGGPSPDCTTGIVVLHYFAEAATIPVRNPPAPGNPPETGTPMFDSRGFPIVTFVRNSDGRLTNKINPADTLDKGLNPDQRLTLVGNRLFAVTTNGGVNGTGVVFSVLVDGSDFKSMDFDVSPPTIDPPVPPALPDVNFGKLKLNLTGAYPLSGLLLASDGFLYGTASSHGGYSPGAVLPPDPPPPPYGGPFGYGVIFRVNPIANADPNPYPISPVLNFTGGEGVAPGAVPAGDLIIDHEGLLVGTAAGFGIQTPAVGTTPIVVGAGAIFKFNIDPSATIRYTTPFVFAGDFNNANFFGFAPATGVIELPDGNGYAYYGITSQGGQAGQGAVFKFGAPTNREPLGIPPPFDDGSGGGAMTLWLLAGLMLLGMWRLAAGRRC